MPRTDRPVRLAPWLALALLLVAATTASAHKVMLFAVVDGDTVTGYAYAPGGTRLPDNAVAVFGPGNEKLATTKTDAQGNFTYTPKRRCDLRFEMITADGHRADYTVHANELPPTLPGTGAPPPPLAAVAPPPQTPTPPPCPGAATGAPCCPPKAPCRGAATDLAGDQTLARLVDQAVSRHVAPLREQLEGYEQKVRWHDILGGIGYIIGLAGMAAYGMTRKDKR